MRQNQVETVIFLHLPKAAGTTLCDIIARQYQPSEIYLIDGRRFIPSQEEFKQLEPQKKQNIKILMGHMYFGLHQFIPNQFTYVTLLRNPIDRVVSYYSFVRDKVPSHPDHALIHSKNLSIEDYCRMGRENMNNGQTRFLSNTPEDQSCHAGMLDVAKNNLHQYFSFIGIQERFDESLLLLKQNLGWQNSPYYYQRNTNRGRNYTKQEISPSTRAVLENHNQLDLQLYEYACQVFEQEVEQQASQLQKELKKFRFTNKVFGRYSIFLQSYLNKSKA